MQYIVAITTRKLDEEVNRAKICLLQFHVYSTEYIYISISLYCGRSDAPGGSLKYFLEEIIYRSNFIILC